MLSEERAVRVIGLWLDLKVRVLGFRVSVSGSKVRVRVRI